MSCGFCQQPRRVITRAWQHMQPHRPHLVICETCKRPIVFMHRSVLRNGKRHHTACLYQRRHIRRIQ